MFRQTALHLGVLILVLAGCGGSGSKQSETAPKTSTVFHSAAVGPSVQCPAGGIEVQSGIDQNGNGALDANEVQSTQLVCNGGAGAPGLAALVRVTAEGSGAHCAAGGLRIETGLDLDGSGTLSDPEVVATNYVCNGTSALPQAPIIAPLALSPAPALAPNAMQATFAGSLGSGDVLLSDGARADFLAISIDRPGVIYLDTDTSQGRAAYFLFSSACETQTDISTWGSCALPPPSGLNLAVGRYVLLVKQAAVVQPWDSIDYGARVRFFPLDAAVVGQADTSFGTLGTVAFEGTTNAMGPAELCLGFDSQGRLLLGWWSPDDTARVARLTNAGALDTSFASTGVLSWSLQPGQTFAPVETATGALIVSAEGTTFQVSRILASGVLDSTFGANGTAALPFTQGVGRHPVAIALDGTLTIAGAAYDSGLGKYVGYLSRLDADGRPVATFGDAGILIIAAGLPFGMIQEVDGTILVWGSTVDDPSGQAFVASYGPNGLPSPGFGTAGVSLLPHRWARALQRTEDGALLVGGTTTWISGNDYWVEPRIARLLASGALDPNFGAGGILALPTKYFHEEVMFAFDSLGRLLVAGQDASGMNGWPPPGLRRWWPSGDPDLPFGASGRYELQGGFADELVIGPDGLIYVAGRDATKVLVGVERIR